MPVPRFVRSVVSTLNRAVNGGQEFKANPAFQQYGTRIQLLGNAQPIYAPRNYQLFAKDGYSRCITAHRCISMVATDGSGIPWKLYKKSRGGSKKQRKEVDDHPAWTLFCKPNDDQKTRAALIHDMLVYWKLAGNQYLYANRLRNGEPKELWSLRPDRVKVVPTADGPIAYEYRIDAASGKQTFHAADVLHLKFTNPLNDLYGLSELEVAAAIIDQVNSGDDRNTALLQNAARPSGGLFAKAALSDPEFERLNDQIMKEYSGIRNSGIPLFFDGDMDWKQFGLTPMELDWLKSRAAGNRDICVALGVPSMLLGDTEAKTYANYETAFQHYLLETVLPLMDWIRDSLNNWLLPMYPDGDTLELDYVREEIEALQENRDGISARSLAQYNGALITMNEARRTIGQDDTPGGDVYKFVAGPTLILVPADRLQEYAEALAEQAIQTALAAAEVAKNPPPPPQPLMLPPGTGGGDPTQNPPPPPAKPQVTVTEEKPGDGATPPAKPAGGQQRPKKVALLPHDGTERKTSLDLFDDWWQRFEVKEEVGSGNGSH